MKGKWMNVLYYILVLTAFGYVGFRGAQVSEESPFISEPVSFAIVLVAMFVMFLLQIILHEGGHLVAGLLSGYRFVSFRIGSLTWVKTGDGKVALKRMNVQGTGGQCLLCPPDVPTEKCPYKLYHLMGGLTNLVLGAIGILLAILLPENRAVFCLCELFGVVGIVLGLTNLIPFRVGGMQNDGYNLWDLRDNMTAKECINLVLSLNALITVADSYADLPESLVSKVKSMDFSQMDLSNSSIANAFNMQAGLYFAEGDYEMAHRLQEQMLQSADVLPLFKNEAKCECLYYELTHGASSETIEQMYDKNLQKYIKTTSIYPSRQRLMYAYYALYLNDEKKAADCMKQLEKMIETYAIKADARMELATAQGLKAVHAMQ